MTPDDLVAELRVALPHPGGAVTACVSAWRAAIARGELSAATVAEAGVRLLETLSDADGTLDMVATELVREFGEGALLPRVRAVRARLRPRVAVRDWRFEVDKLISVLVERAAGRCECAAEAAHGAGTWGPTWVVEEESEPEPYVVRRRVRCARCGRMWRVDEEFGYHYPVYRWSGG